MNKYLPKSAILKESLMQYRRRLYIEQKLSEQLKPLKEKLKAGEPIDLDLLALGFNPNHALNLKIKMKYEIDNEERRMALSKKSQVKGENRV